MVRFVLSAPFVLLSVALLFTGCSAVESHQTVRITTFPPGATVMVNGETGRSPVRFALDRSRDHTVRVELDGFSTRQLTIRSRSRSKVTPADYLLLGIPLLFKGDAREHYLDPATIDVQLDPAGWSPR
jgi:hypothetical protein